MMISRNKIMLFRTVVFLMCMCASSIYCNEQPEETPIQFIDTQQTTTDIIKETTIRQTTLTAEPHATSTPTKTATATTAEPTRAIESMTATEASITAEPIASAQPTATTAEHTSETELTTAAEPTSTRESSIAAETTTTAAPITSAQPTATTAAEKTYSTYVSEYSTLSYSQLTTSESYTTESPDSSKGLNNFEFYYILIPVLLIVIILFIIQCVIVYRKRKQQSLFKQNLVEDAESGLQSASDARDSMSENIYDIEPVRQLSTINEDDVENLYSNQNIKKANNNPIIFNGQTETESDNDDLELVGNTEYHNPIIVNDKMETESDNDDLELVENTEYHNPIIVNNKTETESDNNDLELVENTEYHGTEESNLGYTPCIESEVKLSDNTKPDSGETDEIPFMESGVELLDNAYYGSGDAINELELEDNPVYESFAEEETDNKRNCTADIAGEDEHMVYTEVYELRELAKPDIVTGGSVKIKTFPQTDKKTTNPPVAVHKAQVSDANAAQVTDASAKNQLPYTNTMPIDSQIDDLEVDLKNPQKQSKFPVKLHNQLHAAVVMRHKGCKPNNSNANITNEIVKTPMPVEKKQNGDPLPLQTPPPPKKAKSLNVITDIPALEENVYYEPAKSKAVIPEIIDDPGQTVYEIIKVFENKDSKNNKVMLLNLNSKVPKIDKTVTYDDVEINISQLKTQNDQNVTEFVSKSFSVPENGKLAEYYVVKQEDTEVDDNEIYVYVDSKPTSKNKSDEDSTNQTLIVLKPVASPDDITLPPGYSLLKQINAGIING